MALMAFGLESLRVVEKGEALKNFLLGFRRSSTIECYLKKLKLFLRFAGNIVINHPNKVSAMHHMLHLLSLRENSQNGFIL